MSIGYLMRTSLWLIALGLFTLFVFEGLYRSQVVDVYLPELRSFNPPQSLVSDGRQTMLFMGDSFTAGPTAYPNLLRGRYPEFRIVNSAISGTAIHQASILAPLRFRQFEPSIFVYQVYIGNDLLELRYPVNWGQLSLARNIYWMIANHFHSVSFLNYRLVQSLYSLGWEAPANREEAFSPEKYTYRARVNLLAEPSLLDGEILLAGRRAIDFEVHARKVREMLSLCKPGTCRSFVVIVPHCAQVTRDYLERFQILGAQFSDQEAILELDYPYVRRLKERLASVENAQVLDLLSPLRKFEESGQRAYFQNDTHLNQAGQQRVADFLAAEFDKWSRR